MPSLTTTTPSQRRQRRQRNNNNDGSHNTTTERRGGQFTAAMRDRQARGKDPYKDSSDDEFDDEDTGGDGVHLGRSIKTLDSFEQRDRRVFALGVLDSHESLAMYALTNNDSIPSQRHRFRAMLAGFDVPDPERAAPPTKKRHTQEQQQQQQQPPAPPAEAPS